MHLRVSLRARLAFVLAGVAAGPVAAAGLVVGVVVPRAQDDAGSASLARDAATAGASLAAACLTVGDVARATALDLAATLAAGRPLDPGAATRAAATALRGHAGVGLVVTAGQARLATAGHLPDAAGAAVELSSCSRGVAAAGGAALVESVPVPQPDGAGEAARVVAVQPLDAPSLDELRGRLGLRAGLLVVPAAPTAPAASAASAPSRASSGGTGRAPLDGVASAVRGGRTSGATAGLRYRVAPPVAGVPYRIVAWTPAGGGTLPVALAGVAAGAVALSLALLAVVLARLTAPLSRLARAAARLRDGDLDARADLADLDARSDHAGHAGRDRARDDDVGELAGALGAVAERLQGSEAELRAARAAQAGAAARLGEALDRTHDLEGLLQTVLVAACAATDAAGGAALLGTGRTLEERRTTTADGSGPLPVRTAEDLATLARLAMADERPARSPERPSGAAGRPQGGAAPAVAVPLRARERVLGALALTREVGAQPFADGDVAALADLAGHTAAAVTNVLDHEEARRLSVTDPLTGAGNFRQLSTTLAREVERATRFGRPLSVVMLDLDHFKLVNDGHGHAFGDAVLRELARRLQDCLREVDTVARYGGEEFTVVLPETGAEGAAAVAGRIVQAVRDRPFVVGGRSAEVTVSAGVAAFPDHGRTASEVLRAADAALYAAKGGGRDRWCLAEVDVPGLAPDGDGDGAHRYAVPSRGNG